jgi:periplasmic protein TonB
MNTPIYADFDKIVFEGREQGYGAYQMRKRYNRILTRASLIAFLLFISITALPKMVHWIMPGVAEDAAPKEEMVTVIPDIPIPPKDPVEPVELPKQAADPKPPREVDMSEPKPTPAEQLHDEKIVNEIDKADSAIVSNKNTDGDPADGDIFKKLGSDPCPTCPISEVDVTLPVETDPNPDTFVLLEKEPQPVNLDDLKALIGYPPIAVEGEIEGKVIVRVLMDKHGNYKDHKVLKNPHPILTNAVTSKLNHLKMTPGIQAGRPISVWVTLPFNFELMH